MAIDGPPSVEKREPVLGDVVFLWDFCISIFDSCPFCLVWSCLILAQYVVLQCSYLCYLICAASRLRLSEASWDVVRLGGPWSGSLLVDLVYRMAYLLVRVEFYPN